MMYLCSIWMSVCTDKSSFIMSFSKIVNPRPAKPFNIHVKSVDSCTLGAPYLAELGITERSGSYGCIEMKFC